LLKVGRLCAAGGSKIKNPVLNKGAKIFLQESVRQTGDAIINKSNKK